VRAVLVLETLIRIRGHSCMHALQEQDQAAAMPVKQQEGQEAALPENAGAGAVWPQRSLESLEPTSSTACFAVETAQGQLGQKELSWGLATSQGRRPAQVGLQAQLAPVRPHACGLHALGAAGGRSCGAAGSDRGGIRQPCLSVWDL
jgi:hypothetical protein